MPASLAPVAKSASKVSAPPQVSESIRTCMRSLRSAMGARPGTGRGSGRTVAWIEVLSWRPNAPGGDRKRPQGWALALRRTALRGPRGTRARGRLDHRQGARARPHAGRHPGEGRIATSGPEPRRGAHGTPLLASSSRGRDTGRGCLGSHGLRGRSWGLRRRPAGRRPERRAAGRRGPGADRDPGRPAGRCGLSRAPPANPARRQPVCGVGAASEAAADALSASRHRVRTWQTQPRGVCGLLAAESRGGNPARRRAAAHRGAPTSRGGRADPVLRRVAACEGPDRVDGRVRPAGRAAPGGPDDDRRRAHA